MAALATDLGTLLTAAPAAPEKMLGAGACARLQKPVGSTGRLDPCALVEGCWASPAVPLMPALQGQLALPTSASLRADIVDSYGLSGGDDDSGNAGSGVASGGLRATLRVNAVQGVAADVTAAAACGLSAASLGLTTAMAPAYAQAGTQLQTLCATSTSLSARLNTVDACSDDLLTTLSPILADGYATPLLDELAALEGCMTCDGWPALYDELLEPFGSGAGRDGLLTMGGALLLCALLAIVWVGLAIAAQVQIGHAYQKPGCPSRCSRCCPCCFKPGKPGEGGEGGGGEAKGGRGRRRGKAGKRVAPLSVSPPDDPLAEPDEEAPPLFEKRGMAPKVRPPTADADMELEGME
eukprot:Transcript_6063.p5 GENE.Transcript_6063~~Transcript_6063.p5  ORF type:complete len:353 (+),score=157.68 Transcript_6063:1357-2415(+)